MSMAAAWVDMCQPSATSAIDPKTVPAVISITIIAVVSAMTIQVRLSLRAC